MLILSLAVLLCGVWYVVTRAGTAEVTARWIEVSSEFAIRGLRAHAAAQHAAEAAYRAEWQRRWNVYRIHEQGELFWSEVARQMGADA